MLIYFTIFWFKLSNRIQPQVFLFFYEKLTWSFSNVFSFMILQKKLCITIILFLPIKEKIAMCVAQKYSYCVRAKNFNVWVACTDSRSKWTQIILKLIFRSYQQKLDTFQDNTKSTYQYKENRISTMRIILQRYRDISCTPEVAAGLLFVYTS